MKLLSSFAGYSCITILAIDPNMMVMIIDRDADADADADDKAYCLEAHYQMCGGALERACF